jgi:hypothetical protein
MLISASWLKSDVPRQIKALFLDSLISEVNMTLKNSQTERSVGPDETALPKNVINFEPQ